MKTIEINKGIQINFDDLAHSLSKLNRTDLKTFFKKLNSLLIDPLPSKNLEEETLILKQIKDLVPNSVIRQLKTLQIKQNNNTITQKEREEMLLIIDFIESKSTEKIELIATLAKIKNVSITELAKQIRTNNFDD